MGSKQKRESFARLVYRPTKRNTCTPARTTQTMTTKKIRVRYGWFRVEGRQNNQRHAHTDAAAHNETCRQHTTMHPETICSKNAS